MRVAKKLRSEPRRLALLAPIFWRYLAILVQFGVLVLVARHLVVGDAARYFSFFGLVTVGSMVVAFGIPDGAVRTIPALLVHSEYTHARQLVSLAARCVLAFTVTGVTVSAIVILVAQITNPWVVLLVAAWCAEYCVVFAAAQLTTGLGHAARGTFTAYSATNLCYLITTVPYLVFAERPNLFGVVLSSTLGAGVAVLGAVLSVIRSVNSLPASASDEPKIGANWKASLSGALRIGAPMMCARVLQATLPWTPVWGLEIAGRPEQAAIYAAASRLVVAVTAVIAALRFSVRPRIVMLNETQNYAAINRLCRQSSVLSAIPPVLALVGLIAIGSKATSSVLGSSYNDTAYVLIILMAGVLGEAYGGVSDEVLKMIGHTFVVLASMAVSVTWQVVGTFAFASSGAIAVAWVTAVAFCLQYVLQVEWLRRNTRIRPWVRSPNARHA